MRVFYFIVIESNYNVLPFSFPSSISIASLSKSFERKMLKKIIFLNQCRSSKFFHKNSSYTLKIPYLCLVVDLKNNRSWAQESSSRSRVKDTLRATLKLTYHSTILFVCQTSVKVVHMDISISIFLISGSCGLVSDSLFPPLT